MAALTLGTLATAAVVGAAGGLAAKNLTRKPPKEAPLPPPPDPKETHPWLFADTDMGPAITAARDAQRKRGKGLGHKGTLLTGPRGLDGSAPKDTKPWTPPAVDVGVRRVGGMGSKLTRTLLGG